jgi:hypothetical protein
MMMTEMMTLITPSDVVSVGFECPACKATFFVPLGVLNELPTKCHNCRESWMHVPSQAMIAETDAQVMGVFIDLLKKLNVRKFGAAVRLEIAQPKKETL